jgi:hypothetical protein
MFNTVYRYKDITQAPAMVRLNGEKAISICGSGLHAYVTMRDGIAHYFRATKSSYWEIIGFTYCQTY